MSYLDQNYFPMSEEQSHAFHLYFDLLSKWARVHNLVQKETLDDFFQRHVLNSLELLDFISSSDCIVDVGSGAGFPGIPLAIMGVTPITLVESNHKKCSFLRNVISYLSLDIQVMNQRVETMNFQDKTVICRAFAPLERLLSWVNAPKFILLKGKTYQDEIDAARKKWTFDVKIFSRQSETFVLTIQDIAAS